MFEYAADDGGIVNDSDDAHGVVAFGAFERIHLVDLLDEPGPVGFGFANRWCFVQVEGGVAVLGLGCSIALPPCPITVPAVIVPRSDLPN